MLPDLLFPQLIDVDLQTQIANTKDLDVEVTDTLTTILEQGPATIRWELGDWTVEKFEGHNIIFFKGKNYILRDDELRCDITKMFHNHETAGHLGELETHNAI